MDFVVNFSQPAYELWIHTVAYYRFNGLTYTKFPVDIWEDACGWLSGKKRSFILDIDFCSTSSTSKSEFQSPMSFGWTNLFKK